jgi:hypothetical protein
LNRQIPRVQHDLKWIDAVVLYCSFDTRVSGRPNPCSDASKDEGGGDGEQTDLPHLGLLFVRVHWPLIHPGEADADAAGRTFTAREAPGRWRWTEKVLMHRHYPTIGKWSEKRRGTKWTVMSASFKVPVET